MSNEITIQSGKQVIAALKSDPAFSRMLGVEHLALHDEGKGVVMVKTLDPLYDRVSEKIVGIANKAATEHGVVLEDYDEFASSVSSSLRLYAYAKSEDGVREAVDKILAARVAFNKEFLAVEKKEYEDRKAALRQRPSGRPEHCGG